MSILNNAVRSIQIGLEDYDDSSRVVSAIRNIHAGILLLYKEKLLRLSPAGSHEVLIKQRIVPSVDASGTLVFIGKGKKTADVATIKERFAELGVSADWKGFQSVTDLRNNVEHYYSSDPSHVLQEIVAKALVIVRDFVKSELADDPATLLGADAWQKMLEIKEVFDREKVECGTLLSQIKWGGAGLAAAVAEFSCEECLSSLVAPVDTSVKASEVTFACRSCGHRMEFSECIERLLDDTYAVDAYESAKCGDDPPICNCPDCQCETFVREDERCANCGYVCEYEECSICSEPLGPDEQEQGGLCSYHADIMSRPD